MRTASLRPIAFPREVAPEFPRSRHSRGTSRTSPDRAQPLGMVCRVCDIQCFRVLEVDLADIADLEQFGLDRWPGLAHRLRLVSAEVPLRPARRRGHLPGDRLAAAQDQSARPSRFTAPSTQTSPAAAARSCRATGRDIYSVAPRRRLPTARGASTSRQRVGRSAADAGHWTRRPKSR